VFQTSGVDVKATICLHPTIEEALTKWLRNPNTPAFVMYGEPGVGKTTLVYRVCREEGFAVKEFNASHTRTGSAFRQQILPLLEEPGITSWISEKYHKGHVVLLDEMDGMSSGERGGLQELLKYIRAMRKKNIVIPLICCCNIIQGRKAQQLLRLSMVFEVKMPTTDLLSKWLGRQIKDDERGSDLRQLLRGEAHALRDGGEEGEEEAIAKMIAHHTLFDEMDIYEEIIAETKDVNLASLLVHQNLLTRIGPKASLEDYAKLMEILRYGDLCDFWAFFHQCWPLLNISLEFKCKLLNIFLQRYPMPPAVAKKRPSAEQLEYTLVLTKQSSLFNAWKEICIRHDTQNIPIHYVCDTVQSEAPKLVFSDPMGPAIGAATGANSNTSS
jgi:DNA polymerase III delta prime subunit